MKEEKKKELSFLVWFFLWCTTADWPKNQPINALDLPTGIHQSPRLGNWVFEIFTVSLVLCMHLWELVSEDKFWGTRRPALTFFFFFAPHHKDALCYFEQILEAALCKTAATELLTSHLTNHPEHCWRSEEEHKNDDLQRTLSHGHTSVSWLSKTYIHQIRADTGCCLENLARVMATRDEWWESQRNLFGRLWCWWWWVMSFRKS